MMISEYIRNIFKLSKKYVFDVYRHEHKYIYTAECIDCRKKIMSDSYKHLISISIMHANTCPIFPFHIVIKELEE